MREVIAPTLHLNGSHGDTLLEALHEATRALRKAESAVEGIAPNGRDYYMFEGAMDKATAQHRRWAEALRSIRLDIEAVYAAVDEQNG